MNDLQQAATTPSLAHRARLTHRVLLAGGVATALLASEPGRMTRAADATPVAASPTTETPIPDTEWAAYGRDPGGMRHSPLARIARENVQQSWPRTRGLD